MKTKINCSVFMVSCLAFVVWSCSPAPTRKPGTTKKVDTVVPGVPSTNESPDPLFQQEPPDPNLDPSAANPNGDPNAVNPNNSDPKAADAAAIDPLTGKPKGEIVPGGGSAPAVGSGTTVTEGSTQPMNPSNPSNPSNPATTVNTGNPVSTDTSTPVQTTGSDSKPTLNYKTFFKAAEPTVPNKRHGSWNYSCLSLRNAAGVQIASSICNKKNDDSCFVYHASNNGVAKAVSSDLLDNGVEIRLAVTTGASYCSSGALGTDDTKGFRYLKDGVASQPDVYSSTGNNNLERFKCAKKAVTGGFKYKVCMEDNIQDYKDDPKIWDFNDFVLILESSKEITISGVTCVNNGPELALQDSTCAN